MSSYFIQFSFSTNLAHEMLLLYILTNNFRQDKQLILANSEESINHDNGQRNKRIKIITLPENDDYVFSPPR